MKGLAMRRDMLLAIALVPLLAGCGNAASGGGKVRSTAATAPVARPVVRQPVRQPPRGFAIQMIPGLEGVLGAASGDLVRQFGAARLDVWEGDARKLQFSGAACVLDVFLYPPEKGAQPLATYVDARRASDGKDVDKVACVAALRGR